MRQGSMQEAGATTRHAGPGPAAVRGLRRAGAAVLALAVACGGAGNQAEPPPPGHVGPVPPCAALRLEEPARHRPLLLVVADTLRRDQLGAYGGPARTPRFDAFAEAHHLFTRASVQSPWTKPSMGTLFTGLYPSAHGAVSHPEPAGRSDTVWGKARPESDALAEDLVTLAELLSAAGYRTAAFVSNPWLRRELGFAQGFETFDDSFAMAPTPGDMITLAGLEWLDSLPEDGRPWFLYLHYFDPHLPYLPIDRARMEASLAAIRADDRPVTPAAAQWISEHARSPAGTPWVRAGVPPRLALLELLYDQGVEAFDAAFGHLLDGLGRAPGGEDAAILVTSDHGESLFHRGWRGHGFGLYEAETGVPLAARLPGVAGPDEVACPVGLVDVRATLCAYLDLECPAPDQGVSMLGSGAPRYLVTEGVKGRRGNRAIRNGRYKLIYRGARPAPGALGAARHRRSLYDLVEDPGERHDLLADPGARSEGEVVAARLTDALREAVDAHGRRASEPVRLDEEVRRRLEELGYVAAESAAGAGD